MSTSQPKSVLFYSHDSYGLGHLRRTVTLATELVTSLPGTTALIATGSPVATRFQVPSGVDILKLPSITKDQQGRYTARGLLSNLDTIVRLRSNLLLEALRCLRPNLLVVDHKPVGLCGELEAVLQETRSMGTRTILGLRDIIDSPEVVAQEWSTIAVRQALSEGYDRICVYGDPIVFDARREYAVPPELSERLEYTGYVGRPSRALGFSPLPRIQPNVVLTVGGGQDGETRIHAYLDCLEQAAATWTSSIVLGPLFDPLQARKIQKRASNLDGVRVHRHQDDLPSLFEASDAVVAMAGYNTAVEILQSRTPAVFLPRTEPRLEQWIRSKHLAALGLAEHLEDWSPQSMRAAIERALARGRGNQMRPDMGGRQRFAEIAAELLGVATVMQTKVGACA